MKRMTAAPDRGGVEARWAVPLAAALVVVAMLALAIPAFAAWTVRLQPVVDKSVQQPHGIASGDLNGDGFTDIAATNSNDDQVSVLLGNGHGAFSAPATYTVSGNAYAVAIADVNADGKQDLIVTDDDHGKMDVLMNTGSGHFAAEVPYVVGSNPRHIAVADLNADHKPDIAVSNEYDGDVIIMLNDGTGAFAATQTVGSGVLDQTHGVALADLDGDTVVDLVVTDSNFGVTTFKGVGDGTFVQPGTHLSVGDDLVAVAAGDLNRDGKADLVAADSGEDSVLVLLQNSGGGFSGVTPGEYGVGTWPVDVALSDLNGDGAPDILTADYANQGMSYLISNDDTPSVTFQPHVVVHADDSPTGVCAGLFNGDAKPDFASANWGANNLSIALQTEASRFASVKTSASTANYGAAVKLSASLVTSDGPAASKTVYLWRRTVGTTAWTKLGTAAWSATAKDYERTDTFTLGADYKFSFAGDGSVIGAADSATVRVYRRASLSTPALSTTKPKANKSFTVSGTVKPKHSGKTTVQVTRLVSGAWKTYTTKTVTNANATSTSSKWSLSLKLPKGSFRVWTTFSATDIASSTSGTKAFTVY